MFSASKRADAKIRIGLDDDELERALADADRRAREGAESLEDQINAELAASGIKIDDELQKWGEMQQRIDAIVAETDEKVRRVIDNSDLTAKQKAKQIELLMHVSERELGELDARREEHRVKLWELRAERERILLDTQMGIDEKRAALRQLDQEARLVFSQSMQIMQSAYHVFKSVVEVFGGTIGGLLGGLMQAAFQNIQVIMSLGTMNLSNPFTAALGALMITSAVIATYSAIRSGIESDRIRAEVAANARRLDQIKSYASPRMAIARHTVSL